MPFKMLAPLIATASVYPGRNAKSKGGILSLQPESAGLFCSLALGLELEVVYWVLGGVGGFCFCVSKNMNFV